MVTKEVFVDCQEEPPEELVSRLLDASKVAKLYFHEVVKLSGVRTTIVSDRDVRSMRFFGKPYGTWLVRS